MYSMDNLLQRVKTEQADELRLHVGGPPVIVYEGKQHALEGPTLMTEDTEQLLQSVADTRQRRELREHGMVQFIYQFRGATPFVVCAKMEGENVGIDIH